MSALEEIKSRVCESLKKLYENDTVLFERNNRRGLCERCLVFRLGIYLQEEFREYFVDCDFNSAIVNGRQVSGKPISNPDNTTTKRFVDIIVHRRLVPPNTDFICFEIKKWNNSNSAAATKDQNNLRVLTSEYGYKYGFYLILGRTLSSTKWVVFRNGEILEQKDFVFNDENR